MCEMRSGACVGAVLFCDAEPEITIADGVALKTFRSGDLAIRIALPLSVYQRDQDLGDEAIAHYRLREGQA